MLVTVYDADGKPHAVEGVDAREYLASGQYTAEPPGVAPAPVAPVPVLADTDKKSHGGGKKSFDDKG